MSPDDAKQRSASRLPVAQALQRLVDLRRDHDIVVTNQASARLWPTLSDHRLDLNYNPSTMGGAIPLALGLAVAQPLREVQVITGEGSLLMSLGSLVTVVASGARNLTIVVLDNGMYEVTGGQATPATNIPVDFAALASAAGFPSTCAFSDLAEWESRAGSELAKPGPRLLCLKVGPTDPAILKTPSGDIMPRIDRFRAAVRSPTR